jgi:S-DNA-T family DNA segregation ATPase FtsK/SpoIIIE
MSFLGLFKRGPDKGGSKPPRSKDEPKARSPRGKKGAPPPPPPGLSLDQKLDILGIGLILVGLLLILAFVSPTNSDLTAPILRLLGQLFGLGRYLAPAGFIALGGWIVLRHFGDRLPALQPERVMGWLMIYVVALVSLHFVVAQTVEDARAIAESGQGGGFVGYVALYALLTLFGTAAAVVIVLAFWLIALILAFGITTQHLITAAQWLGDRLKSGRPASAPPAPTILGRPTQLPLPNSGERPAPAVKPSVNPFGGGPAQAQSPAQAETPPAAPRKSRAPELAPASAPAASAPPASALPPAPLYDQPIILGNSQPWVLPNVAEMLDPGTESGSDDEYDRKRAHLIEDTLSSFGAPAKVVEINRGPTITQFGVEPDYVDSRGKKTKVKVGKISSLSDDLALALAAPSIRIEAPVPGKGYVGIEVPNNQTAIVALRDVMESEPFRKVKTTLGIGLGQDVSGQPMVSDITKLPHLLIAGTTGSGKSVCVNAIIVALLLQNTPDDLKLLMVDPKRVELTSYNGIPHLLTPVVVDLERVVSSLQWVTREMDDRYRRFAKLGVRNVEDHNARLGKGVDKKIPYLVVIIDELADLMMLAPDETEKTITRLAQMARATGIHLIIATQRPSVDVVTGLIKANFPARIAFAVASSVDSRVILDQPGAEKLLGRGDMLFQSPDAAQPQRMQGVFLSDAEIHRIVRYWKGARGLDAAETTAQAGGPAPAAPAMPPGGAPSQQQPLWEELRDAEVKAEGEDDLLVESIKVVREMRRASITLLQRRLRIGYTRAARLIDLLEEKGIVGPAKTGAQQREVIGFSDMEDVAPANAPSAKPPAKDSRTWENEE